MFRIARHSVELTATPHVLVANAEGANAIDSIIMERNDEKEPELDPLEALELAREQAQELLAAARQEAEQIREKAGHDADEIRAHAYNRAIESGRAEAKRRGDAEIAMARKELTDLTERVNKALNTSLSDIVSEWEDGLLGLSIDIARKIIGIELERNDKAFLSLVQGAISHMRSDQKIAIHVNLREYERYFKEGSAVFHMGGKPLKYVALEDNSIEQGGCMIESDGEMINAGIDQQLSAIAAAMAREEAE